MDFKRNIFWIAIVVVVLGAVGGYFATISGITVDGKDIEKLKSEASTKAEAIKDLAKRAGDPDAIKNPEHVKLASDYKMRLENQLKAMQEAWKTRKMEVRFTDAPADSSTKFDAWLGELRAKLTEQATKANLLLPADADKMMFKESTTDDVSTDITRHRGFRLRQMAIIEETIGVMSRKFGKQQIFKFEPDKDKQEPQEVIETGVVALERISITPPKAMLGAKVTDIKGTSEERLKMWMEDGVKRSGRATASGRPVAAAELPYTITSIDIQFLAPLSNIPAVVQALEGDARFGAAVVTRVDYQRAVTTPYPSPAEPKLATAGPVPILNTHYQEAPVRALVSLDIYEYDAAKEAALKAKAEAPMPSEKDKKKTGR